MRSKVITALVAVGMMMSVAGAADVAKLKIEGIGLGDNFDKVKKNLPCKANKRMLKNGGYVVNCAISNYDNSNINIIFDQKNLATEVSIYKLYSYIKDFNTIKSYIISKYGKPDAEAINLSDKDFGYYELCYGDCEVTDYNGGGINLGNKYLVVRLENLFVPSKSQLKVELSDRGANDKRISKAKDNFNVDEAMQKLHQDSKVTWKVKSKFDNPKSYDPEHSATIYNISCSNGKSDVVSYFYNKQQGIQYFTAGRAGMATLDEAANSICGNR